MRINDINMQIVLQNVKRRRKSLPVACLYCTYLSNPTRTRFLVFFFLNNNTILNFDSLQIHTPPWTMAASFCYQPAGLHGSQIDSPTSASSRMFTRFLSMRFACNAGHLKLHHPLLASTSHAAVVDPTSHSIHHHLSSGSDESGTESTLILIRHGESLWNEKNLFTGCCDVPLTKRGVEEAIEAGKRISCIPIDVIFTSALIRAQMTAMLAMTQHRRKKVPIIIHNESEQATTWTQVYSEKTTKQSIPVITSWQLNERMYGELQGLNKQETAERYGQEKVHEWRRSYDIPPPKGESLEMCSQRAVAYFKDFIEPQLKSGKHVMVAAHGNSLRSIIMYLERLTSQEVTNLELSTGIPLLYIYKEGEFISRGSPVGPTEAGVYAYTQSLAVYRQQLEEKSH
ncbi:2,3-bisphosphoglycerate-dependent phosphoglycerate mutase 1-like [Lotus japonicus]|uniref:2,3-bisphosphoglycerate-dependent phosphoglycerate mutase 1-like n=1 Tax=Lotus japonicus TaxID=34305 RepID=UPI0025844BCC|nr:2,3-bisphosphoglycerate-dependent phosphoglycerate mutase 1-like [Lotus japonicus]